MFYKCYSLTRAPQLPATKMESNCYAFMFSLCESLVTPPDLPADVLAEGCYQEMFSNCVSLSTAPELPATTLATYCYAGMFENCSNLVQAPELPATQLEESSYNNLFKGCTSLNYIKVGLMTLDNDVLATYNWVMDVDGPGTFVFPCGSTYDKHGDSEVPTNFEIRGLAYELDSLIEAEGSFTWGDITYTENTSWSDTLQTSENCDSIINYRLEIKGTTPITATFVDKDTAACDLLVFKEIT